MLATNESQENDEEEEQSIIPTSLNQNFAISVVNEQSSELPNSERSIQPRRVTVKKADFNGKHEENVKLASLVN
ncbi:hypothetical protein [Niallia taxi]|uniref:hypothetical protein n=1 Tax=Niallia taxi TaxID=2499688 RepID=UPI00254D79FF|nr:hypothetical protein [Niallia taxi]MDK8643445.1 hypothetical protein [Niallia taxi]